MLDTLTPKVLHKCHSSYATWLDASCLPHEFSAGISDYKVILQSHETASAEDGVTHHGKPQPLLLSYLLWLIQIILLDTLVKVIYIC